jgi:DNA-binding transcriptional ArsR family regulator
MNPTPTSHGTLWRTCRVLANRSRLRALGLLFRQPSQTVSAVAEQLHLTLPVASQYLRALEARGLLTVRRKGRHVFYRPVAFDPADTNAQLIAALRTVFAKNDDAVERVFKLATAFTHTRRVEIFRAVHAQPGALVEIQAVTHVSAPALYRHLRKLESRGLVKWEADRCVTTPGPDALYRALARLAAG